MVWGSFPDAVDVVKPNDIFHLLMSHFHLGCLKVADSYTYFSYLSLINLYIDDFRAQSHSYS